MPAAVAPEVRLSHWARCRVTADQAARLEAVATEKGTTASDLLRQAVLGLIAESDRT